MSTPEVNETTHQPHQLHQMTTAELNRAILAVRVLTSPLVEPYIADPVLASKLASLKADLNQEFEERP